MKFLLLTVLLLGIMALSGNSLTPPTAAGDLQKETAIVEFVDQIKLGNVLLRGRYFVVHDEDKMLQGGDCLYIYKLKNGQPHEFVVSFHCTPVERKKADRFTVLATRLRISDMLAEVREIQFAGSSVGHQVPQ